LKSLKSQNPTAKSQQPKAKSQKPKAKSQKPKAKSHLLFSIFFFSFGSKKYKATNI